MENVPTPKVHSFDKILHVSAYLILTLSWLLTLVKKLQPLKKMFVIALAVFIFGIIVEVLQGTVTTYRQADFKDMLANLLGTLLALSVFSLYLKKNRRIK